MFNPNIQAEARAFRAGAYRNHGAAHAVEICYKTRSLGFDTVLRAYSTGARFLNLMTLSVK